MTVEICKEYERIVSASNKCDTDADEYELVLLNDEFHLHISVCKVCMNQVYYDQGHWKFSNDEGTKCKRCLAPPGFLCRDGCEDMTEKELGMCEH
jgi:hypothetical protein